MVEQRKTTRRTKKKPAARKARPAVGVRHARTKTKPTATRTARLEARISPENRAMLMRAAEIQGKTVTEFVTSNALEAAHQVIAEVEMIRLSRENQKRFVAALLAPPKPNAALQKAFAKHKARVRD